MFRVFSCLRAVLYDNKIYMCQIEPKYNDEELLATPAKYYSDFGMICKQKNMTEKIILKWYSYRHCDIVPENA